MEVGVIGWAGYVGAELVRLLVQHPQIKQLRLYHRSHSGEVGEFVESLAFINLQCTNALEDLATCQVVFFCTPHTVAMEMVAPFIRKGTVVIDLSADFRISDVSLWEKAYKVPHTQGGLAQQAAYGMVAYNQEAIQKAQLIAVPGCYPTLVQLLLAPLLLEGAVDTTDIIIDAKSGVSGAGKELHAARMFCAVDEGFGPYALQGHRHVPEIVYNLQRHCIPQGQTLGITFVPHLIPTVRGMQVSIYVYSRFSAQKVREEYTKYYASMPFVRVSENQQTKFVRGTVCANVWASQGENNQRLVLTGVDDNLLLGAAGQAVMCMNLRFSFSLLQGLPIVAAYP